MNSRIKFIFDLDGTVTSQETLPLIAKQFKVESEMEKLTMDTINGNIPFFESFIKRVNILGKLPVDKISKLLEDVSLYENIVDFIKINNDKCIIATGNVDCWVSSLLNKIGCDYYCSNAMVVNNRITKLNKILRKDKIVQYYKRRGIKIVYIGDGNNDMEAMRQSHVSIASGLTHEPAASVLSISNYLIYSEKALCRLLNQLL